MAELREILAERVAGWREGAHPHDTHPALAEILLHARHEDGSPRYLREPQIRPLETYWYPRFPERTPRIEELYERLVDRPMDRHKALGLDGPDLTEIAVNEGYVGLGLQCCGRRHPRAQDRSGGGAVRDRAAVGTALLPGCREDHRHALGEEVLVVLDR